MASVYRSLRNPTRADLERDIRAHLARLTPAQREAFRAALPVDEQDALDRLTPPPKDAA